MKIRNIAAAWGIAGVFAILLATLSVSEEATPSHETTSSQVLDVLLAVD